LNTVLSSRTAISRRSERLYLFDSELQSSILNRLFTIRADAVLPRYRCNPLACGTVWEECLTVTDMNRLEQAARVSMGEFQDPEASAEPFTSPHHTLLWGIVLAAASTILLIALFQLT